MEIDDPNTRYKVCFICKKYMPIFPCNHISTAELKDFEKIHSGHMQQIVNFNEIPENFTRTKTNKERKETLDQIQEMLKMKKHDN